MASQSLYRKWRSQTFGDLVGQEPVIRTLKNALSSDKLAHAYIFTGPRGTGKTSTARLLAKTINCLHPKDGEPCNVCEQCREITAGNSFNVLEIDAASNRGIDSIRELREKVMVPPTTGRYKVYILDEAHMLTTEAFNALLKTLEEPPPHAIFVLATTDVHKMLPTVLSRCQRFDFKRITTRQIVTHLQFVAQQEKVELEPGAAELVARAAAGGMRDALSLLDQAIAYSGKVISLTQVQAMLGVADPHAIRKFLLYIADLDSPAGLHLIHELAEAGADLRQINTQVAEYWRALMLAKAGANIAEILDYTEDETREILQLVKRFTLDELTESSRIFAQNELMQKGQGTPQLGLELALLACIELHRRSGAQSAKSVSDASGLPSQTQSRLSSPPASQSRPERSTESSQGAPGPVRDLHYAPVASPSQPVEKTPAPPVQIAEPLPVLIETGSVEPELDQEPDDSDELPDWDGLPIHEDEELEENTAPVGPLAGDSILEPEPEEEAQPLLVEVEIENEEIVSAAPTLTVIEVKDKWEYVIRRVRTKKGGDGAKVSAFLKGFTIEAIEGTEDMPIVVIKAIADFHYKALQKDEYSEMILWAMKIELGMECKLRMLSPSSSSRPMGGSKVTASNMLAIAPTPSAHLERPKTTSATGRPASPVSQQMKPTNRKAEKQPDQTTVMPKAAPVSTNNEPPASPLARTEAVSENTNRTTSEQDKISKANEVAQTSQTRQQLIEQHAKNDPVVREVMRVFKAEIKSIQPK